MRIAKRLFLSVAVCIVASTTVQAQDRRLDSLFTPPIRGELQSVINTASQDHLPTEPLIQRALEGGRRGVDGPKVVSVVRAFADRMRVAQSALGTSSSEAELLAGAGALYLGVARGVLERMRRDKPGKDVALPLIVMADIIERGVPKDTATALVVSLNEARLSNADYTMLRQSILLDIGAGAPAGAAASARVRGLLAARAP